MLEKPFLRSFFAQIEAMTAERLDMAIEQVLQVQRVCSRGTDADADARFMLRHLRRRRLELVLRVPGILHR